MLSFIPIFIFLTDTNLIKKNLQRYYTKYILIGILILIATYVVIDYKRNINESEFFNLKNLWIFIHDYGTRTIGPIEAIIQSISLRITGGSELMAIMSSSSNYENTITNLVFNKNFIFYELPLLIKDIFNIDVGIDGNKSTGKALGLFGLAYLSKNLLLYSLIIFNFGILIGIYERSVKFLIGKTASILLTLYLAINLWEGSLDLLFLYLTLPIVLYSFNLIVNNSKVVKYYIK
jgi:hypothetical protein